MLERLSSRRLIQILTGTSCVCMRRRGRRQNIGIWRPRRLRLHILLAWSSLLFSSSHHSICLHRCADLHSAHFSGIWHVCNAIFLTEIMKWGIFSSSGIMWAFCRVRDIDAVVLLHRPSRQMILQQMSSALQGSLLQIVLMRQASVTTGGKRYN